MDIQHLASKLQTASDVLSSTRDAWGSGNFDSVVDLLLTHKAVETAIENLDTVRADLAKWAGNRKVLYADIEQLISQGEFFYAQLSARILQQRWPYSKKLSSMRRRSKEGQKALNQRIDMAKSALTEGYYAQAKTICISILRDYPQNHWAKSHLEKADAGIQHQVEAHQEARQMVAKAIELFDNGDYKDATNLAYEACHLVPTYRSALELLEKIQEAQKQVKHVSAANGHMMHGELAQAEQSLKLVTNPGAHFIVERAYRESIKYLGKLKDDQAKKRAAALLNVKPTIPHPMVIAPLAMAQKALKVGNLGLAQMGFERVLDIDPVNTQALFSLNQIAVENITQEINSTIAAKQYFQVRELLEVLYLLDKEKEVQTPMILTRTAESEQVEYLEILIDHASFDLAIGLATTLLEQISADHIQSVALCKAIIRIGNEVAKTTYAELPQVREIVVQAVTRMSQNHNHGLVELTRPAIEVLELAAG